MICLIRTKTILNLILSPIVIKKYFRSSQTKYYSYNTLEILTNTYCSTVFCTSFSSE